MSHSAPSHPQRRAQAELTSVKSQDVAGLGELRQTVSEVARILSVRRWTFFIPFCVLTTAAFLLSLQMPRRYVVSTVFGRKNDPVLMNLPEAQRAGNYEAFRKSLSQDVINTAMLTDVVKRTVLANTANGDAEDAQPSSQSLDRRARSMASRIASGLEIVLHERSQYLDIIEIKYSSSEPENMAVVLDEIRETYIRNTRKKFIELLRQTRDWFEEQRAERQALVDALEEDLIEFKSAHHGLNPLNPDGTFAQLNSARSQFVGLQRKQKDLETRLAGRRELAGATADSPRSSLPSIPAVVPGIVPIKPSAKTRRTANELRQAGAKIQELQATRGMTERHPEIVVLRRKEQLLERSLERSHSEDARNTNVNGPPRGLLYDVDTEPENDTWTAVRSEAETEVRILENLLADNRQELDSLEATILDYEMMQKDALEHRREFSTRRAEVARAAQQLILYQTNADQVGRVLNAESSQRGILFENIKSASGSAVPVSPRTSMVLLLSLLVGLGGSAIAVLLRELFDRTVRTRVQITRALGLPILESIDEIISVATQRRRRFQRFAMVPMVTSGFVMMVMVSGSVAYLSLQNKALYERVLAVPRSVLERIVEIGGNSEAPDRNANRPERSA